MNIAVAIASKGRPRVLAETLAGLQMQTRRPDSVWISVPSSADHPEAMRDAGVHVVYAPVGLTCQRNALIDAIGDDVDVLIFLDDDTELHPTFLARACDFAMTNPEVALFGALVVADGVREGEIARAEARAQLVSRQPDSRCHDVPHVYGCCMAVHADIARKVRFDEALRQYGWLEDRDFGLRVARMGRVVVYNGCELIHLGVSSGRQSGVRLGFQQVVHPSYLRRKGVLGSMESMRLIGRPIVANLVGGVGRRSAREDRKGRLRGNVIGLRHLVFGDGNPRAVERLS